MLIDTQCGIVVGLEVLVHQLATDSSDNIKKLVFAI